jgi:hypothetical protein
MTVRDDRTKEQRKTHPILVVGTDRFMSGWDCCNGGTSFAAWACTSDDEYAVERWVRRRGDQSRVRIVMDSPERRYRPRGGPNDDLHIYVVGEDHPARKG